MRVNVEYRDGESLGWLDLPVIPVAGDIVLTRKAPEGVNQSERGGGFLGRVAYRVFLEEYDPKIVVDPIE